MGVYIDMEMPSIDLEWRIIRGQDGKWYAIDVNAETSDGEWHEIVPVPPHGRLGDLDKLEQTFVDIDNAPYSGFDGSEPFYSAEDAAQIIRLAPTIIPAEGGET